MTTGHDCGMVEELILDYAWKNYMDNVISAMVRHRGSTAFTELNVPHLRIVVGTIYSIVRRKSIEDFDSALQLLGIVHRTASDVVTHKHYVKLTTGLKAEIMLNKLFQPKFDYADAFSSLNQYFPKSELRTAGVSQKLAELNAYQLRYRRLLTRLMLCKSAREGYRRDEMDAGHMGSPFVADVQRLLRQYADRVNERLAVPVIEQIIAEGPQSQITRDLQDSQSDSLDQLLAASFQGPPSQDVLLTVLTTAWDEESAAGRAETNLCDSDGDDEDDMSDMDIFDFPGPSASLKTGASALSQQAHTQESLSLSQDRETRPNQVEPATDRPTDKPDLEKAGPGESGATSAYRSHKVAEDCPSQLLEAACLSDDTGCLSDKTAQAEEASCIEIDAAASFSSLRHCVDHPRDSAHHQPPHQHSPDNAVAVTDVTGLSTASSEREAAKPTSIHQQKLDNTNHQQPTAPSSELTLIPETHATRNAIGAIQILPDTPLSQLADQQPHLFPGPHHLASQESCPVGRPVPSTIPDSPQEATPVVALQEKGSVPLVLSSSSPSVSRSRIYLSKTGWQGRAGQKRTWQTAFDQGPCTGLTGSDSWDPPAGRPTKTCKTCVGRQVTGDSQSCPSTASSIQISSSSGSSEGLSDESSTSVSLLSGMTALRQHAPKHSRSWSPAMTILEEEVTGLTMLHPFEDTFISDIEVYPVTRLKRGGKDHDSVRQRNSRNNRAEGGLGTSSHNRAVPNTEPYVAEQDNTISSSDPSPILNSQPAEVGVQDEVRGHQPSRDPGGQEPSDVVAHQAEAGAVESDQPQPVFHPRDEEEAQPLNKMPSESPVIILRRLSQDPEANKFLDSPTCGQGEASGGKASSSSDSEESVVPDSEGEDSDWMSDSSSLPFIELRPDSDDFPVRRFPSLSEFLPKPTDQATSGNYKMVECTVQLRRLKQDDIEALTSGRSINQL